MSDTNGNGLREAAGPPDEPDDVAPEAFDVERSSEPFTPEEKTALLAIAKGRFVLLNCTGGVIPGDPNVHAVGGGTLLLHMPHQPGPGTILGMNLELLPRPLSVMQGEDKPPPPKLYRADGPLPPFPEQPG